MLKFAIYNVGGPVAIRYPRGRLIVPAVSDELANGLVLPFEQSEALTYAKAEVMTKGADLAILAVGSMGWPSYAAATLLSKEGIKASVINMRFIKPLDVKLLKDLATTIKRFALVEEAVLEGGFGSSVLEFFEGERINDVAVRRIGLPSKFIEHGKRDELLKLYGLTAQEIVTEVKRIFFKDIFVNPVRKIFF